MYYEERMISAQELSSHLQKGNEVALDLGIKRCILLDNFRHHRQSQICRHLIWYYDNEVQTVYPTRRSFICWSEIVHDHT
jgi:hypothetical protein